MDELIAHLDPGVAPTAEIFNALVDVVTELIVAIEIATDRVALLEEAVFGDWDDQPEVVDLPDLSTYDPQGAR